jgi:hypothetical protein
VFDEDDLTLQDCVIDIPPDKVGLLVRGKRTSIIGCTFQGCGMPRVKTKEELDALGAVEIP